MKIISLGFNLVDIILVFNMSCLKISKKDTNETFNFFIISYIY